MAPHPDWDPIRHGTMQCDAVKKPSDLKGDMRDYALEAKFDGFRLTAEVGLVEVDFYTREGKLQNGKLPHVETDLLNNDIPPQTIIDGEVVALRFRKDEDGIHVDSRFEFVQQRMLSLPERARELQQTEEDKLRFMAFDITMLDGEPLMHLPLQERAEILRGVCMQAEFEYVQRSEWYPCQDVMHDTLVARGFEGTVAKHLQSPYQPGTRGKGWYKIKAQHSVDVVILGFTEGEGKYSGQIGAVIFGQSERAMLKDAPRQKYDFVNVPGLGRYIPRGQCSGMTDAMRLEFSQNRSSYTGAIMEITHNGLMAGGIKFRHPQFARMRSEKPIGDVIWHDR